MKTALILGQFIPLTLNQIESIYELATQFTNVYLMVLDDPQQQYQFSPPFNRLITGKDRLRMLKSTFKKQSNIHSMMISPRTSSLSAETILATLEKREIPTHHVTVLTEASVTLVDRSLYNVTSWRVNEPSREELLENPYYHYRLFPAVVKEWIKPQITICGGESSGKTTLVDRLSHLYQLTPVWEYGRIYVENQLGGDEESLQYSDYYQIARMQQNTLHKVRKRNEDFILSDTDFVTTLAFCKTYENKDNPELRSLINEERFGLTILMENNVPWIPDGQRSLGEANERTAFQNLLKQLYDEFQIPYIQITAADYTNRFLACQAIIKAYLKGEKHLQKLADGFE